MAKQPGLIELIQLEVQKELKAIKHKKRTIKLKLIFTLILPAVIILLTVKVVQTYIRIELKRILTPDHPAVPCIPKAITPQRSRPDFITPKPVSAPVVQETVTPAPVVQKAAAPVSPKPSKTNAAEEIIITEITDDPSF